MLTYTELVRSNTRTVAISAQPSPHRRPACAAPLMANASQWLLNAENQSVIQPARTVCKPYRRVVATHEAACSGDCSGFVAVNISVANPHPHRPVYSPESWRWAQRFSFRI